MTDAEDPREAARRLIPLIRECADEAERDRRLPQRLADAMAAAGLYRMAAPRSVGGGEVDARRQIETIEIVSAADGAAGWTLMIGVENLGFLGACLEPDFAQKLFADPGLIVAGALNPLGRAVPVDGGYLVTGQWPFGSGCHNADYFWGQCVVMDGDTPATDDGRPILREALVAQSELEILDTWHVAGLRGSGSHDVAVKDVLIPHERMTGVFATGVRQAGTLFRFPAFNRLAYNKVGVSTGIARAAIDHFIRLASEKLPRGSGRLLRDESTVQLAVADAEAQLRSARAFVFEAVEDVWQATADERAVTPKQSALVHLACSHAAATCVRLVEGLASAAGTTANFTACPLERCVRDVRVVPQHIMVSTRWSLMAGRVLLGVE